MRLLIIRIINFVQGKYYYSQVNYASFGKKTKHKHKFRVKHNFSHINLKQREFMFNANVKCC